MKFSKMHMFCKSSISDLQSLSQGKFEIYIYYIYVCVLLSFFINLFYTLLSTFYSNCYSSDNKIHLEVMCIPGAPGWLRGLSLCLQLMSWSQGPGIEPRIGLSVQQGACFLRSLPASLPTCGLCLSNK